MVEVLNAQVKLHPVNLTGELPFWFILADAQAGAGAHVHAIVGREDEGHGAVNPSFTHIQPIHVEGHIAAASY